MKKKETYKIQVKCLNCDYGNSPFDVYEDIEFGERVPSQMLCPLCGTWELIKV